MTFLSFSRKEVELKAIVLCVTSQVSNDKYSFFFFFLSYAESGGLRELEHKGGPLGT